MLERQKGAILMIGRKRLKNPIVLLFSCCMVTVLGLILSLSAITASASGKGGGGGNKGGGNDNNAAGNKGGNAGGTKKGGKGGNNPGERKIGSLKTVTIPGPSATELNDVIKNTAAAIAVGKAFFWDMQFGSDGVTACATCHFTAGTDNRSMNQANPGFRRVDGNGNPAPDSNTFHTGFGPNHQLSVSDFPLHKLSNPAN